MTLRVSSNTNESSNSLPFCLFSVLPPPTTTATTNPATKSSLLLLENTGVVGRKTPRSDVPSYN